LPLAAQRDDRVVRVRTFLTALEIMKKTAFILAAACVVGAAASGFAQNTTPTRELSIQLRSDLVATGDVKLKDVVENAAYLPSDLAERVVCFRDGREKATLLLSDVEAALATAGIRPDAIHLGGAVKCQITFNGDTATQATPADGLLAWAGEEQPTGPQTASFTDWDQAGVATGTDTAKPTTSLHAQLAQAVADRFGLPGGSVDLAFKPRDARLVALPHATLQSLRGDDLGRIRFRLVIDGAAHDVTGQASATIPQTRLVVPVARGAQLRSEDLATTPARITRLADRSVTPEDALGQEAARGLDAGSVLTPDRLAPQTLVRRGQPIAVSLSSGGVELRILCTAMQDGTLGDAIRVKNDKTGKQLQVVVTGKAAAAINH
ncbi:MAG: flagellar basal body P-ring formation chaperone FlgA, partial [Planctomycetota bacterium]